MTKEEARKWRCSFRAFSYLHIYDTGCSGDLLQLCWMAFSPHADAETDSCKWVSLPNQRRLVQLDLLFDSCWRTLMRLFSLTPTTLPCHFGSYDLDAGNRTLRKDREEADGSVNLYSKCHVCTALKPLVGFSWSSEKRCFISIVIWPKGIKHNILNCS